MWLPIAFPFTAGARVRISFGSPRLSKITRFSAVFGEGRNEFCPQRDAQKPGARPDSVKSPVPLGWPRPIGNLPDLRPQYHERATLIDHREYYW